jgi:hypothetical protein
MSNTSESLQQAAKDLEAQQPIKAGEVEAAKEVAAKELGDQAQQVLGDRAAQLKATAKETEAKEEPKSLRNKIIGWFKSWF